MDFWSRLIRGRAPQPTVQPSLARARFDSFRLKCQEIVEISASLTKSPDQPDGQTNGQLVQVIAELSAALATESRLPPPHHCFALVQTETVYVEVATAVTAAADEAVVVAATSFFTELVDSDDDIFLADRRFARALVDCVGRTTGTGDVIAVSEASAAKIVELLFAVAAKIRLQPALLQVWFAPTGEAGSDGPRDRFPLCYQLVHHVHHDSPIGDFARTGLLYVFESAGRAAGLEEWLAESDLPSLMASSLGALFSQLSRKVSIGPKGSDDVPIVLMLSDWSAAQTGGDSIHSPVLQRHLATFLSYLTLWEDMLEHCDSASVKAVLIDRFRQLFLEQLLYPAMLQSSDSDGGSSVAVLVYLRRIIETVHHPRLVGLVLGYLLAAGDETASLVASPSVWLNHRARPAPIQETTSGPALFSLSDLIVNSIRSSDGQTVTAALRLVGVLMHRTHEFTPAALYRCRPVPAGHPRRTHGGLTAELQEYMTIAAELCPDDGWDVSYKSYVEDGYRSLEAHSCFVPSPLHPTADAGQPKTKPHLLDPDDGLARALFSLVESFLSNEVEVNLALSQVFISAASCQALQLDGWLALSPEYYVFDSALSPPMTTLHRVRKARQLPSWSPNHAPAMLRSLQAVLGQVSILQHSIPTFQKLVSTRRKTFQLYDNLSHTLAESATKAPALKVTAPPDQSAASSSTPPRPPSLAEVPPSPVNWISQRVREALDPSARSPSRSAPGSQTAGPGVSASSTDPFTTPASLDLAASTQAQIQTFRHAFRNLADSMNSLRVNLASQFDDNTTSSVAHSSTGFSSLINSQTEYPRIAEAQTVASDQASGTTVAFPDLPVSIAGSDEMSVVKRDLVADLVDMSTHSLRGRSLTFPLREAERVRAELAADLNGDEPGNLTGSQDGSLLQVPTNNIVVSPTPLTTVSLNKRVRAKTNADPARGPPSQDNTNPDETTVKPGSEPADIAHLRPLQPDGSASPDGAASSDASEGVAEAGCLLPKRAVSLNHVLTNVVILQEFVLELAAIMQARASLFGEVMLVGAESDDL